MNGVAGAHCRPGESGAAAAGRVDPERMPLWRTRPMLAHAQRQPKAARMSVFIRLLHCALEDYFL
jgi:hypothetical protein